MKAKAQSSEVSFELHTLGWKAFQNLSVTIMGDIWGQVVQGFFDSHDGGRDGAFNGNWESKTGEAFSGSFTAQCKFTAKENKCLSLSDLSDEITKAKRLADKGLSDNYILFTNMRLTGSADEKIIQEVFEEIPNIKNFAIYGVERISQIIQESPRLRMLVPRIYGLGDLSQILDQRAYEQASEIISSLGEDLSKFIITDAYRKSAKALVDHGFVLLLGEPMCGKSTIAASLAMGAIDEWGCSTIKITSADDFVTHFNPNEKQLFWVDDAFGATQFDWGSAARWNQVLPHLNAAIHKGTKVIFTSRDYIYKAAKRCLKESAIPVINESQVVIHVENLTKDEREQILYNHIKLGRQDQKFKEDIKSYLPNVAAHERFSPEIARRLGNPFFTKNLSISSHGINNFVSNPLELLCEIIETMDDGCKSALALVFMRGGNLPSPLNMTADEENAVSRLGGSRGEAVKGLENLHEGLLVNSLDRGSYSWKFKHPTVRDAFSKIVASSQDLMDIYLTGAPIDKLFAEITCGSVEVMGASISVAQNQFDIIIDRIKSVDTNKWFNKQAVCRFLSYRCDKDFLSKFIHELPEFIGVLTVHSYVYLNAQVDLVVKLNEFGLLPEAVRTKASSAIQRLAIDIPESGFMKEGISDLLTDEEKTETQELIKTELLPSLSMKIEQHESGFDKDDDPEAHFEELKDTLNDYRELFAEDESSCNMIDQALTKIEAVVGDLQDNTYSPTSDSSLAGGEKGSQLGGSRSIFDDIDC